MKINRDIREERTFTGGPEPYAITARVVISKYWNANVDAKTLVLFATNRYAERCEVSIETLREILKWATE